MLKRKSKTKKELYDSKKKELEEDLEYLRQVDVPESQGGAGKFVRDTRKEEKRKDKEEKDRAKNWLESQINARISYRSRVAEYGYRQMFKQNFPVDWEYYCIPTAGENINIFGKSFSSKEGILFIIKSPKGNVYTRGILATYNPEYDVKAVDILVIQVENTIDSEKGILLSDNKDTQAGLKKTKTGLYLPN